ncbi:MAG: type II secretion system protein GspI [Parvularculaceae bacterium]
MLQARAIRPDAGRNPGGAGHFGHGGVRRLRPDGAERKFRRKRTGPAGGGIVADNILITELARSTLPELGEREDLVAMAGRNWVYLETVQDVGERAMLITVEVRGEDSQQVLASVSGVRETQ